MKVPTILTGIFGIAGGGADRAWSLSHLFWPFVSMVLFGLWLGLVIGDRSLGLLSSVILILGNDFLTINSLRALLGLAHESFRPEPLFFTRHFSPGVVLAVFAGALWTTTSTLADPKRWKTILAGLLSGALFYTYLFYWVIWFPSLLFLTLWIIARRDWRRVRHVGSVMCIGTIVAIPWFVLLFRAHSQDYFLDYQYRMGLGHSQPNVFHHTVLLVAAIAVAWRFLPSARFLLSSIGLAGLLILNQDYVTGLPALQKEHFHANFLKLFECGVFILAILSVVRRRFSVRAAHLLAMGLAILSSISGAYSQTRFARASWNALSLDESTQEVLAMISIESAKDAVIFSDDPGLTSRILLYTRRPVLLHAIDYPPVTFRELVERAALVASLLRLSAEEADGFVDYRFTPQDFRQRHRELLRREIEAEGALERLWKQYRLDYLVLSRHIKKRPDPRYVNRIRETARFTIFELTPPGANGVLQRTK